MKRIAILDNSVDVTGALLSAHALASSLREQASFIFVLPLGGSAVQRTREAGFAVRELPLVELGRSKRRLLTYLPALLKNSRRLRCILQQDGTEILIANDYYNLLPSMIKVLGWQRRIITIIRLLPHSQNRMLNWIWLRAARFASDRVLAVSAVVARQASPTLSASIVYFPVEGKYLRQPYTAPPSDDTGIQIILYLANYIAGKGHDIALLAFARVANANHKIRLIFAGSDMGLAKNAAYRQGLELKATELGVADKVQFLGRQLDPKPLYLSANVVLNFSRAESFSQTCAEAGLLGRPVIATRSGGPEEIILDGATGMLVDLEDIDAMAACIDKLISSSILGPQLGRAAQLRTNKMLDPENFIEQLSSILRID